jgi:hypothetical protein
MTGNANQRQARRGCLQELPRTGSSCQAHNKVGRCYFRIAVVASSRHLKPAHFIRRRVGQSETQTHLALSFTNRHSEPTISKPTRSFRFDATRAWPASRETSLLVLAGSSPERPWWIVCVGDLWLAADLAWPVVSEMKRERSRLPRARRRV